MSLPNKFDSRSCSTNPAARRLACGLLLAGLATAPAALLADVGDAKTIASGLSNPRGIAFAPNGGLYVTEGGRGGPGPCILSPVQPPPPAPPAFRCYGETGAVTRILPQGGFRRIATGLPSMALANGTSEGGPARLSFQGNVAYVVMGLGGDPNAVRASLGGGKANLFGTLLRVTPSGQYQVVSDIAAHEAAFNPAGGAVDSNPYGVLAQPGRRIVADAGANALIEAHANGSTRTLAVLPQLPPPPFPRDAVPTSVAEGPDGALYVGLLSGFPFFQGSASVLRVECDGSGITTYASGLTAVVDVAFDTGGALYVLETASGQVPPFPPPNPGLGAGRLKRQCPGGSMTVLLDGLTFPGGLAIGPDDAAYITNFGTSADGGEVLRLPVSQCP
ncbi:MAG TPA: ScyD/ScyE family protein [Steroidobacteraceae bacterium]|nr:ScyD/ScyE family protein [Steroidobacteraceae bacterium]